MTNKHQHRTGRPVYVSEFTGYMDKFLDEHPNEVANQRRGWNIFRDRKVDLEELK